MKSDQTILLCSASPSRAALLAKSGISFEQKPVAFDEEAIEARRAEAFVYQASRGKMAAALAQWGLEKPLLTADSVVTDAEGTILRKARDIDDARRTLLRLSGSECRIISSVHFQTAKFLFVDTSATYYRFDPFDRRDLERYLDSDQWKGKAGACMVEGFCRPYIRETKGFESTAMGLQVEVLLPWLEFSR